MDALDRKILETLMSAGRTTWAELASTIGRSPPSTAERVRKLEDCGIIQGYRAVVDPEAVGYGLLAFVAVSGTSVDGHAELVEWAKTTAEVQECHSVAGEFDYLFKLRCRDAEHLEELLHEGVRSPAGMTRSVIVLSTRKETSAVPLNSDG